MGAALPEGGLEEMLRLHAESHRHYHTLEHVLDCLEKAKRERGRFGDPAAVELALWYHDAIYAPRRSDNEADAPSSPPVDSPGT